MALRAPAFAPAAAARASRASVRVCATAKHGEADVQKASAVAAAFAAAALLTATPASAGVILEQPQLKKVLQDTTPAAPAAKREFVRGPGFFGGGGKKADKTAAANPAAKKAPQVSVQGGDLDPRAVALPGSLALIAGGAFALTKVDEEFGDFMTQASCKDSGAIGAGYEEAIKGGAIAAGKRGGGTKKVKAAASKAGSKAASAAGSPLGTLFGKK